MELVQFFQQTFEYSAMNLEADELTHSGIKHLPEGNGNSMTNRVLALYGANPGLAPNVSLGPLSSARNDF